MSDPTREESPQLEYAPPPGAAWISRHRKLLIVVALSIAMAVPIWRNWESLKHRAVWLYWSRRAAAHVMPASSAAVTVHGPDASQIAATNPDYQPVEPFFTLASSQQNVRYVPVALRELLELDGRLSSMRSSLSPAIFMGTVHRLDGTPRLVIITGQSEFDSHALLSSIDTAVLPLPGWFDPIPAARGMSFRMSVGHGSYAPATYLTGTIDSQDPSHLVIPYVLTESTPIVLRRTGDFAAADSQLQPSRIVGQGEIDVHLQNDDSLNFSLRGPAQLAVRSMVGDRYAAQQAAEVAEMQRMSRRRPATAGAAATQPSSPSP